MKHLLLILLSTVLWCAVPAVQAAAAAAPAAELERQIAVGRLQTQLEQDLRLLESMKSLAEVLEELVPYADAMTELLAELPNTGHLQQALHRMRQRQHPPALPSAPPPPLPMAQDMQLVLLQPPRDEQPGKAIFRIGDTYEIRYQDEELNLHGRRYRLQEVSADAVHLAPLDGGAARVVQWQ